MLKDQSLSYPAFGQPCYRLPNQIPSRISQVLTHPDAERPRRPANRADVVGQVGERGIVIQERIVADILVEENGIAKEEIAKDQRPDKEQTDRDEGGLQN